LAASEAADHLLTPLLGPPPSLPSLLDPDDPDSISPQRQRCADAFKRQRDDLLATLNDHTIKTIVESSSGLGRKWLSVIPYYQSLRLTDFEISAALHIRTLHPGFWLVCQSCGIQNDQGHAEVCPGRQQWAMARHEQVKRAIGGALRVIEGMQVDLEPLIGTTSRRNDIRITGSRQSGLSNQEYDVTVVSLATQDARNTYLPPTAEPPARLDRSYALINRHLNSLAHQKRHSLPQSHIPFTPLVFTLGGLMDLDTVKATRSWKLTLPSGTFNRLFISLSLVLLRARVRNFDL
jgi:hypothetical protein